MSPVTGPLPGTCQRLLPEAVTITIAQTGIVDIDENFDLPALTGPGTELVYAASEPLGSVCFNCP